MAPLGALFVQGRRKDDPKLLEAFGTANVFEWRRSYTARPPPMGPAHPYFAPPPAPLTESLEDCQHRVSQYYEDEIKPYLIAGSKVC